MNPCWLACLSCFGACQWSDFILIYHGCEQKKDVSEATVKKATTITSTTVAGKKQYPVIGNEVCVIKNLFHNLTCSSALLAVKSEHCACPDLYKCAIPLLTNYSSCLQAIFIENASEMLRAGRKFHKDVCPCAYADWRGSAKVLHQISVDRKRSGLWKRNYAGSGELRVLLPFACSATRPYKCMHEEAQLK